MHMLAMLPDEVLGRLRTKLPGARPVLAASGAQASAALESLRCDVLVIDPCHCRQDTYASVVALAARSGARLVFYCRARDVALRRVMDAARLMPVELIIPGVDDEVDLLRCAIEPDEDPSVSGLVLRGLAEPIRRMQPALATATVMLFGGRAIPHTADEFLAGFDAHPRTVQSWIVRANLASVSDLLWCARIAWLHRLLVGWRETLERVADRCAIGARTLTHEFNRLTGLSPRRAMRELQPVEIAQRLVESVIRPRHNDPPRRRVTKGAA